jgi:hypothetical protein
MLCHSAWKFSTPNDNLPPKGTAHVPLKRRRRVQWAGEPIALSGVAVTIDDH